MLTTPVHGTVILLKKIIEDFNRDHATFFSDKSVLQHWYFFSN